MGLTFKPDIDDFRESPALLVAETLSKECSYNILFVEPNVKNSLNFTLTDYAKIKNKADIVVCRCS